jgi:glycosyltransferase
VPIDDEPLPQAATVMLIVAMTTALRISGLLQFIRRQHGMGTAPRTGFNRKMAASATTSLPSTFCRHLESASANKLQPFPSHGAGLLASPVQRQGKSRAMLISVVTVCLNSEATIRGTIDSFLAQKYPEKELIIVDGLSTDRTLEIVRAYNAPEIRVFSEQDAGLWDAMNKGFRLYKGETITFLNSDDVFHDPDVLDRAALALRDADIAYGDIIMISDHETKTVVRDWKAGEHHQHAWQLGWQPPHPGFFVRRRVVDLIGGYDLSYASADYDWMLRAMIVPGVSVKYIPFVLVDFLLGGTSTRSWKNILVTTRETLRSRREHLGAPPVDLAVFLRIARRVLQIRRLSKLYAD